MRAKRALIGAASIAVAVLTTPAQAADGPPRVGCREGLERWSEIDLYFGRSIAGGGEVSEAQFRRFLSEVVTPNFPDGLTVVDADGQFRTGGKIVREKTKLLILLVPSAAAVTSKLKTVTKEYKRRFRQESVLRTEDQVCLSFD
jgi:hypothetical protein